jgi:predicted transcriptional regulator
MSEFQELIKSFGKSRDYVRDFFVYGFKSRQDFTSDKKSARTYDDERRRITSWLGRYVEEETAESEGGRVKNISLQMDSNLLDENPLFAVWKTKSFTDNDVMLHFCIFDILYASESVLTANDIADILSSDYSLAVDTQMVRRKLNEYVKEGLIETEKQGKSLLYKRGFSYRELNDDYDSNQSTQGLTDSVALMQLDSPFGFVGSTILDSIDSQNEFFRVKHSFPSFTLEGEVLIHILEAKKDFHNLQFEVKSSRNENVHIIYGVPLKILISIRTGRRFVCICQKLRSKGEDKIRYRFVTLRLDQIKKVAEFKFTASTLEEFSDKTDISNLDKEEVFKNLENNLDYVWGVSFSGNKTKLKLTLSIDEKYEDFIIQRLVREGKNGTITRLGENLFCYEKIVFDAMEMFPWLRTFIGRLVDIRFVFLDSELNEVGENRKLRNDFLKDIRDMERMYFQETLPGSENISEMEMKE